MIEWYDVTDNDSQISKKKAKAKVRNKLNNVRFWLDENKELIIIFGPAFVGTMATVVGKTAGAISRNSKIRKEKDLKELYCYDRSLGHYWELERKLSNSEWRKIESEKMKGKKLADILSDMKVLK